MVFSKYHRVRRLHIEYKRLGEAIYAALDPEDEEQLRDCGLKKAIKLIPDVVQKLVEKESKEKLDMVYSQLEKAITLRKDCAKYYEAGPSKKNTSHRVYIDFLGRIKRLLGVHIARQDAAAGVEEQERSIHGIELEEKEHDSSVDEQQANEEERQANEEERQGNEAGGVDDDADNLTLDLADFFTFLELLGSMAREAASLWKEAAKGELPIWVASILSGILLCEADSLISQARLLDEESRAGKQTSKQTSKQVPKSPTPWVRDVKQPQLTKGWVDALDAATDSEATWRELTATLPSFEPRLTCMSRVLQCPSFASDVFSLDYMPYVWNMLAHGAEAAARVPKLESAAQVPLATIVGLYFCNQAIRNYLVVDGTAGRVGFDVLEAAREAACATLDEDVAALPRLIRDNSITEEQASKFRATASDLKDWARVCDEPMTIGAIHHFAQICWFNWRVYTAASNSATVQAFFYLCEKRRLEAPITKATADDGGGDDEYERLLGSLMRDPRIGPSMLMDGRPTRVSQCIAALQKWCFIPTDDGETLRGREDSAQHEAERLKSIQYACQVRRVDLLSVTILKSKYRPINAIYARFFANDKEREDSGALRRYLIQEMSAPDCLKLEAILFKVLRKLPKWGEMLANAILHMLLYQPRRNEDWIRAVRDIIDKGLHLLARKANWKLAVGFIALPRALLTAVLKLALKTPGHEESLKAAFADAFQSLESKWRGSFADELFQVTMPEWQRMFKDFEIESLSKDHEVEKLAYTLCLMSFNEDGDGINTPQDKEKRKKVQNKNREGVRKKNKRKKLRNNFVGEILEAFMEEARPILEEIYGKVPARPPITSKD